MQGRRAALVNSAFRVWGFLKTTSILAPCPRSHAGFIAERWIQPQSEEFGSYSNLYYQSKEKVT
jgi:hypothetical protein